MYLLLTRTPIGRAMRAVADNPQLALVRGIESPRVIRWTWFIAGLLLGVGGVLIGMDRALEPLMGSNYLVAVFAAAILGGLGSPLGAFVGAMLIGIVSELSTLVMPPNYRIGIPLVVIAVDADLPAAGPVRPAAHPQVTPQERRDDLVPRPAGNRGLLLGHPRAGAQLPVGPGRHGQFRPGRLLHARAPTPARC